MCTRGLSTTRKFASNVSGCTRRMSCKRQLGCVFFGALVFPTLALLTKLADFLQGGRGVEATETSKYSTPPGDHHHTLAAHFGLDARR